MAKQDDFARYTIRIPRELYEHIESEAHKAGRSLNAEITHQLINSSIRLRGSMISALSKEADKSGRSLNEEVTHRLSNSLESAEYKDFALGFGDPLDHDLMVDAAMNGRTLKEEVEHRLLKSYAKHDLIEDSVMRRSWLSEQKYNEIMELFIQLTPEERRILEERSEIANNSNRKFIDSKFIGELIKMKPIGKSGRIALTVPSKADKFPKLK